VGGAGHGKRFNADSKRGDVDKYFVPQCRVASPGIDEVDHAADIRRIVVEAQIGPVAAEDQPVGRRLEQRRKEALRLRIVGGCPVDADRRALDPEMSSRQPAQESLEGCIAGLETPHSGAIRLAATAFFDSATGEHVPPSRRNIGMVFQSYAIWPHLTVFENVAFPLRVGQEKYAAAEVRAKVEMALAAVDLAGLAGRSATQLSGGQQQRVALARAIVKTPSLLLLDGFLGHLMRYAVDVGGGLSLHASGSAQAPFAPGGPAHVAFAFDSALALPLDDGDDLA
jgi:hypothetical protein